ncbi:hypothetical protein CASFOL_013223 [Castilleja foliolosa]|uniref:F-box domain-containing protein n=1 Tax=Castilleja foliolosa TaxID=1961234 RepID=A0ABD3DJY6_9LAMI
MANSIFPEDLMICILTRLPVKTIIRFKSVCKPWYHLFSTPEFKKLHQGQFSSDPENQFFILHSFIKYCCQPNNHYSIFNIESGKKMPTILDHPFAHAQNTKLYTVGCCNGLVCIFHSSREIVLWNPAMKLSKTVRLKDCEPNQMFSLGFGYNAVEADFKVVMIVASIMYITSVEIYSANLGSWITIDVGFQFREILDKNDFIVNGNPYWVAQVDGNEVLLCFDVLELVFKIVPMPTIHRTGLDEGTGTWTSTETEVEIDGSDGSDGWDEETETETGTKTNVELFDYNGALGALIINHDVEYRVGPAGSKSSARVESVSVLVFDDIERIWRNNHTFGPIELDVCSVLRCIKNEKILGIFLIDKLCVLDFEAGIVKELFDGARLGNSFEVYGYTESLAYINGMENVVVEYERNDIDD